MTRRLPRRLAEPLPRPRLLDALQRAQSLRCIVLVAPAGSGKTALLQSWSRKARSAQARVAWMAPQEGRLARVLAERCAELAPSLGGVFKVARGAREESALADLAIAIVRHEAALPKPLVLVFDALHTLREPAALRGLQPLLDYCPARVQCIFGSRTALPLSIGRLREHGELLELGAAELRWTLQEAHVLAVSIVGDSATRHAAAWHAQTEGWSLGLRASCEGARAGRAECDLLDDAFAFFDAQVLVTVAPEHRKLFAVLGAMELFDAQLAALQSGLPQEQCRLLLQHFASATGFLRQDEDSRWWRFHPTLAMRLRQEFDQLDAARRRRMHRRASSFFADIGQQLPAMRQAVLGGDARRAADLVQGWAGALFQQGRHDELAALVRLVPPQEAARNPQLRVWTALLALLEHRHDDCRTMLATLKRDAARGDTATQRRIRVLQGWLAVFRDDMDAAMSVFGHCERESAADIDDITLAAERNVLSWIHIYRNDYQRARDVQQDASAIAAPLGSLFGSLSGRCFAGMSLALEGRMDSAERIYREVLQEARAHGDACIDPAVLATGLLAETLYELNDLQGVLALQPQLPELRSRSLPDPLLRAMLVMLRAHAVLGRLPDAMGHARTLEAFARERGLERLLSYALLERIRLHLLQQDPDSARPAWDTLAALGQAHAADESSALAEVAMVANRAEILLLLYRGRLEEARALVDRLLRTSQRRGRRRRVAALHFQRAAIERELGDAAAARIHTLQGLRLGARLGLVRSLVDAHPAVPLLLDALSLREADAALAFHADRLRAAAGAGPLLARELGASHEKEARAWGGCFLPAALSEREEQIARLLALALPNKEIARSLGLSPETVKWHLHNMYAKLGVGTRYAAVSLLRRNAAAVGSPTQAIAGAVPAHVHRESVAHPALQRR